MRLLPILLLAVLPCTLLAAQPTTAPSATTLPSGEMTRQSVSFAKPNVFAFEAAEPGVLVLIARPLNDADLTLSVHDSFGRYINGTEAGYDDPQLLANLPAAGTYTVRISVDESSCRYRLTSSFTAAPPLVGAPAMGDPQPLELGQTQTIRVGRNEESRWFSFTPDTSGILTIYTDASDDDDADVYLELYEADSLTGSSIKYADDDLPHAGNEVISSHVEAGVPLLLDVGLYEGTQRVRMTTQLIPVGGPEL